MAPKDSMTQPHIKDNTPMFAAIYDPVIDMIPAIGSSATVVYIILKRMAGMKKSCFPSYTTLAEKTGLSRPTVIAAIEKLIEHGLVTRVQRLRPDGGHGSNSYIIENPMSLPPSKENRTGGSKDSLPKVDTLEGDSPSGSRVEIITGVKPYDLFSWWATAFGIPDAFVSPKELASAKRLIAMGFDTREHFLRYLDWLRNDDFWRTKGIDLSVMASQVMRYQTAKTAPKIKDV